MRNVEYITAELSLLCQEYKDVAKDSANKGKQERLIEEIQKLIEELAEYDTGRFNFDSVFFAGELDHHGKEYEVLYPGDRHEDADDDSEGSEAEKKGGHGNTRLPYGLCEKYGIEVQKGWTPKDAWGALAGKGVSAAEEYKKLRERGRAETKAAVSTERHSLAKNACLDRQNEAAERTKELDRKIIEATNRRIDTEFGPLSRAKSELLEAERRAVKAKKRKDIIAGRTKEELEAEADALYKRFREAEELNMKLYDRPERGTPERAEWDEWCQRHGGRSAISKRIAEDLIDPNGTREQYNVLSNIINNDYDRYGPDGGYKEASKIVRSAKKKIAGYEKEIADAEKEVEEYQRQRAEAEESLKPIRQEYYDAVKERFPTFDDCKTPSDVAERLSAEGAFSGADVMCDFGQKVTLDTAKAVAKSFVDYMEKMPFLKGHCGRLVIEDMTDKDSNVYGYSQRGKGVRLNNLFYGDDKKFEESWQKCMDREFHPPGLTKDSVIQHEYSHQLDDYMTDALKLQYGKFSTLVLNEVISKLGMDRESCKRAVSGYSVNNSSGGDIEWFAEALSEYTGSANPRPIAAAVGECVMKYAQQLQPERHDAADDDGRWVTTENDHRVHINEEGIPDKGNPYVLATMRGEGPNPKSREELARHRVQKKSRQARMLFADLDDAKQEVSDAETNLHKAENELRRANLEFKIISRNREEMKTRGYGKDSKEVMERELQELDDELEQMLGGRSKWELIGKEKEAYSEVEGKRNNLHYLLEAFDECYGPDAVTEASVRKAEEKLSKAQSRVDDANKRRDKAQKEISRFSGKIDQERFLKSEERTEVVDKIRNSGLWGDMSEEGKEKVMAGLENVSDAHLLLLQKTMGNVKIWDNGGMRPESGAPAWYTFGSGGISLDKEHMLEPRTVWHEYGHYLDDAKKSGCDCGKERITAEIENRLSLSNALYGDYAMHSEGAAKDLQKIVNDAGLNYKVEASGHYLVIYDENGNMVEGGFDMPIFKITDAFCERFREYRRNDSVYEDYLRSIGCPLDSEEPKREEYIEYYRTPKRGLLRERERYKGAREEYQKAYRDYREKRETAIEAHSEEYSQKYYEYKKRCDEREKQLAPVSDILCGMLNGRGPWIYGGHSLEYYQYSTKPYEEAVANYHQMRMMGWTHGLSILKQLAPSVSDALEKTYDEWLWRNVDL